ncbi:MAG: cohesin domain-containing protein [Bryobacteraceae bacterium]|jgi:general secretion pathway protein D
MLFFNRLAAVILSAALAVPIVPLHAATKKGDRLLIQGRAAEAKKDWDAALGFYEKALAEDPSDIAYQMADQKAGFEAGQAHIEKGWTIRSQGQLPEAMLEFQRAFAINPGSATAVQEIQTTQDMIAREKQRVAQTGKESSPEERALTPLQQLTKDEDEKLNRILPVPELKPLTGVRDLTIHSNQPRTLFETLGKVAGINVLWDPDYVPTSLKTSTVELQNSSFDDALDYLALLTKSYWKPVSSNTILVTKDDRPSRTNYMDQAVRVFYLSNVQNPPELTEIMTAVRTVTSVQLMMPLTAQNAILVRAEADQMTLVEKIIHDLDRPKAEVVVDIVVMSTTSVYSRQLTAALASTGLNVPASFTPRNAIQVTTPASTNASGTTTPATTTSSGSIPLSSLGHIASSDFSTTLPGALLQAVMSDAKVKILQEPQVRSLDNQKATLKIGDRIPVAMGSYQAGLTAGATLSPLVNTQFQYNDVGVNAELTPRVHDNGDISLHVDLDISSQNGSVNLGGINQPIISQNHVTHDIRLREGEVSLLAGLVKLQDTKTVTGIPGLSSVPLIRRLFTGESIDQERSELMIALIPHIVRRPEYTALNLRAIDVGTQNAIKLNFAPAPGEEAPAATQEKAPPLDITPPNGASPAPTAPSPTVPAAQGTVAPPGPGGPPLGALPQALQQLLRPGSGAALGAPPVAGSAVARFAPASIETTVNGAFMVALVLDGGTDVFAAQPIQIQYDPKLLSLAEVSAGDLFSRDGQQPVFARNIMNDQGMAVVQQLSRPAGAAGVSGPGTLLLLRFQAVGRGTATVGALNVTARNSQGLAVGSSSPQLVVNIR